MRKMIKIGVLLIGIASQPFTACERRPLENEFAETALIPVKIDWSGSNIPVTDPDGNGYVHRVSVRFFPKNGAPAFDRYLETNVIEGKIDVPVGEYSVVVFNESVHDIYWEDAVYFTDVDDYANFAACKKSDDPLNYEFYTPQPGEELIVEPLRLASWSLDDFVVTNEMITRTRSISRAPLPADAMENALTHVVMRPLTYTVKVTAWAENLCSAQVIQGAMRGFAKKVYMGSGRTEQAPATHVFKLNSRRWDDGDQKHGTVTKSFLSFGKVPQTAQYSLNMDVVYVTGEVSDQPHLFDVTDQVNSPSPTSDADISVAVDLHLPLKEGGINVGDWEDEVITIK